MDRANRVVTIMAAGGRQKHVSWAQCGTIRGGVLHHVQDTSGITWILASLWHYPDAKRKTIARYINL